METTTLTEHDDLLREYYRYRANQDEYVQEYEGKVIVLKGGELLGVYDSHLDAVTDTSKEHVPGTFLVQVVSRNEGGQRITLLSPDVAA